MFSFEQFIAESNYDAQLDEDEIEEDFNTLSDYLNQGGEPVAKLAWVWKCMNNRLKDGSYKKELAPKGFLPVVDLAARLYIKDKGQTPSGCPHFTPAVRERLAHLLVDEFEKRPDLYSHLDDQSMSEAEERISRLI
mgnify:CR=1 FL=1